MFLTFLLFFGPEHRNRDGDANLARCLTPRCPN